MKNKLHFKPLEKKILDDIEANGGRVFVVGGTVRDLVLFGKSDNHDIDVEIYNLDVSELEVILSKYGNVNTVGKQFGILKLDALPQFDFALPRLEVKKGQRHQDFDVVVDKQLSLQQASLRRDLTINALMYEYRSNQIYDFYNGIDDLNKRVIRMIDAKTFKEDPLRVLRVAQFASRYELNIEPKTKKVCREMVVQGMLDDLSNERVYQEYYKILMSKQPSIGLSFLRDINGLLPCVQDLQDTPQRLDYHPEGNVLNHTLLVVDLAALCRHKTSNPIGFMWGALLHDIGKAVVTTPEGHAPYHALVGVEIFEKELTGLIPDKKLAKYIKTIIKLHMRLMHYARDKKKDYSYCKILYEIKGIMSLDDLVLISKCDKLGRLRDGHEDILLLDEYLKEKKAIYGEEAVEPYFRGADLLELGIPNQKKYSEILDKLYDLQLQGNTKEQILEELRKYK